MLTASEVLKAYIPKMKQNTVYVAGVEKAAQDISADEMAILMQELDAFVDPEENPIVSRIIARGAPRLLDAIRLVNKETKNGFKGAAARGMELVFNPLTVADLFGVNVGTAKTTWLISVTSTGAKFYSGDATNTNNMLVSSLPQLCHLILGFVNPIEVTKMNMIQLIKNSDAMAREYLQWEWRPEFGTDKTPVYELKQPWIIPPGEKYYIACNYFLTGDDKTQPIGFSVRRATDVIAALA